MVMAMKANGERSQYFSIENESSEAAVCGD